MKTYEVQVRNTSHDDEIHPLTSRRARKSRFLPSGGSLGTVLEGALGDPSARAFEVSAKVSPRATFPLLLFNPVLL